MNINPIYWWREWMKLRVCNTLPEFKHYVLTKLKTPEQIAKYLRNTIYFIEEEPPAWFPIETALRLKEGNCTELAGLGKFALNLLPGYKSEILVIHGVDKKGIKRGHAVAAFEHNGRHGWIENIACYSDLPWQTLVPFIRSDWPVTTKYRWTDESGNIIKGLEL